MRVHCLRDDPGPRHQRRGQPRSLATMGTGEHRRERPGQDVEPSGGPSTVARELTLMVSYLVLALRPLRSFRAIDASPAGASSPEGELVFPAPPRPIPGELPVP